MKRPGVRVIVILLAAGLLLAVTGALYVRAQEGGVSDEPDRLIPSQPPKTDSGERYAAGSDTGAPDESKSHFLAPDGPTKSMDVTGQAEDSSGEAPDEKDQPTWLFIKRP